MPTVEIITRPHEVVDDVFFGDDGPYTFTAGPMPDLLSAYLLEDEDEATIKIVKGKVTWVLAGLDRSVASDEDVSDYTYILSRLDDPKDPLQSKHILAMYDLLVAEVSKVPPTSQPASSPQRQRAGAAKPKRKAATSGA